MSDRTNPIQDFLLRNRDDYQYCESAYKHESERLLSAEDFRVQKYYKIY